MRAKLLIEYIMENYFNILIEKRVHTNHVYMGKLSYVDDITISCPSIHGLNFMLDICQFACDNFNIKKNYVLLINFVNMFMIKNV